MEVPAARTHVTTDSGCVFVIESVWKRVRWQSMEAASLSVGSRKLPVGCLLSCCGASHCHMTPANPRLRNLSCQHIQCGPMGTSSLGPLQAPAPAIYRGADCRSDTLQGICNFHSYRANLGCNTWIFLEWTAIKHFTLPLLSAVCYIFGKWD